MDRSISQIYTATPAAAMVASSILATPHLDGCGKTICVAFYHRQPPPFRPSRCSLTACQATTAKYLHCQLRAVVLVGPRRPKVCGASARETGSAGCQGKLSPSGYFNAKLGESASLCQLRGLFRMQQLVKPSLGEIGCRRLVDHRLVAGPGKPGQMPLGVQDDLCFERRLRCNMMDCNFPCQAARKNSKLIRARCYIASSHGQLRPATKAWHSRE